MWTLIFLLLMIAVFGKLIFFAVKMTWGVTKILFTLVFFPLILIGLVMAGLMYIALPVCEDCVLKKTVISIQIWRFLLTMGNTQSIMKKNQLSMNSRRGFPGEAVFSLQHSIPIT